MQSDLPSSTRDFITQHIASLEQLEVLLLLYEANDRDWSVTEINARLRSQESSIFKWLETLVALGLVQRTGSSYRFGATAQEFIRETGALAEAYRQRRIRVIELIYSKPNENLRKFVRAFELRQRP